MATDAVSGPRALFRSSGDGAAIRAVPHTSGDLDVRLVGETASNLRATSGAYRVSRDLKPIAVGHLPDHTVWYDLRTLPTDGTHSELVGRVKNKMSGYATAWVNSVSNRITLYACSYDCGTNDDREKVKVELDNPLCRMSHNACVGRNGSSLEYFLNSDRTMSFNTAPKGVGDRLLLWTDRQGLDGLFRPTLNIEYVWVDRVIVHELRHTFGLADRDEDDSYYGIMDGFDFRRDAGIKQDDKDVLIAIYETHIRNVGW